MNKSQKIQLLHQSANHWNSWRETFPHEHNDLSEANFDGISLDGVNLSQADLSKTSLVGANFIKGNFENANLSGATSEQGIFNNCEMENANLRKIKGTLTDFLHSKAKNANFQYAELAGANFEDAKLMGSHFEGANLNHVNFLRANLSNAHFTGEIPQETYTGKPYKKNTTTKFLPHFSKEKGELPVNVEAALAGAHFGIAILDGAKLPPHLNDFKDLLKNVEEASRNARLPFMWMLGLCLFELLIVATITDAQILFQSFGLLLPVFRLNIPVTSFFIIAPLGTAIVFVWFHIYLNHVWELVAKLPAVFPDGTSLRLKLHPWIFNFLIEFWQNAKSPIYDIRGLPGFFFGWVMVPLTLSFMIFRFSTSNDVPVQVFLSVVLFAATYFSCLKYQMAKKIVCSIRVTSRELIWSFVVAILLPLIIWLVSSQVIQGNLTGLNTLPRLNGLNFIGTIIESQNFDNERFSYLTIKNSEIEKVNLKGAMLFGMKLASTKVDNVAFNGANLQRANIFDGSYFNTSFNEAFLNMAKIEKSWFSNVDFEKANMTGIEIRNSKFQNSSFVMAKLNESIFESVDLTGSDLSDADLSEGILHNVNLRDVILQRTKLCGSDLTDVRNLAQEDLNLAFIDSETRLPDNLVASGQSCLK